LTEPRVSIAAGDVGVMHMLLQAEAPERWNVTVTNVPGHVFLHYQEVHPTTHLHRMIDIRSAPPGLYLIKVTAGRDSWTRRIIRK
jgi:hypothetical protein